MSPGAAAEEVQAVPGAGAARLLQRVQRGARAAEAAAGAAHGVRAALPAARRQHPQLEQRQHRRLPAPGALGQRAPQGSGAQCQDGRARRGTVTSIQ